MVWMNLTKGEGIKKRWQEYTEELYKKDLHDPDNHDDVITNLDPDTLKCKVKWALGNISTKKASGGDGIPAGLFQILKDGDFPGDPVVKNLPAKAGHTGSIPGPGRPHVSQDNY